MLSGQVPPPGVRDVRVLSFSWPSGGKGLDLCSLDATCRFTCLSCELFEGLSFVGGKKNLLGGGGVSGLY